MRRGISSYIRAWTYQDIILAGLIFTYIILMSRLVFDHYDALYVYSLDFGVFDQALWSTSQGDFMWQSQVGLGSNWGIHFDPLLLLTVPIYYIFPDGRFLLVIQTIFLALGAIPLYLIAKIKFESRWIPLAFPISYFIYPYLHNVNLFDFHSVMFSPLLIGLTWYSIELKNIRLFTVFALLSLFIKENIFVIVILLCIYAFFKTEYKWEATILAAISIIYGIVVIKYVIPFFSGNTYMFIKNNTVSGIITNPPIDNFLAITQELFKPLLYLPLLNPLPYLTGSILIMWHSARDISLFLTYHYPADVISLVMISVILGVANIPNYINFISKTYFKQEQKSIPKPKLIQLVIVSLMLISSIHSFYTTSQVMNMPALQYQQTEHDRIGIDIAQRIPPDATVAAQTHLVPRLSHRKYIFQNPWIPKACKNEIDYVFFDTKPETDRDYYPFDGPENLLKDYDNYSKNKEYELILSRDGYAVFKKRVFPGLCGSRLERS
ncbi:MAG TPA: DUF2079 domain-containing protein [Candidatus Methanoperedens sp.]|nr:DUF2079 domain-containing protein [Candidatus Methanoperedens sp.]